MAEELREERDGIERARDALRQELAELCALRVELRTLGAPPDELAPVDDDLDDLCARLASLDAALAAQPERIAAAEERELFHHARARAGGCP